MDTYKLVEMTFLAVGLIWSAVILGLFIFNSIVYMTLAKKASYSHPWIAWLPFGPQIIAMRLRDKPWFIPIALFAAAIAFSDLILIIIPAFVAYIIYKDRGILAAFGMNPNWAYLHLIPGMSLIVYVLIVYVALGDTKYYEDSFLFHKLAYRHT